MTSNYTSQQQAYRNRINQHKGHRDKQNYEVLSEARLENRVTRNILLKPGSEEANKVDWTFKELETIDGKTAEYIFLFVGGLGIDQQQYWDWFTLYRLPAACNGIYLSAQRGKPEDRPAARALAIYPESKS